MGLPECGIPEGDLPQCWEDDVRMNALFAPFRIKTANPESWNMKMKFWSDMLRQWCRCRKNPVVSAADAKAAFVRKGRTPACLEIVVEEMFRNGDLSPITKYQQILHNGPEGWVKWGARLAFKPAALAFTAVASLLPARQAIDSDGLPTASIDCTQRFVLESAVKEQATELLNGYPSDAECIGTIEDLMKASGFQHGRDTFELLLGYLVAQGSAVKKGDVVKLAQPDKKVVPVTETDEALVKLKSAEARLEGEVARLSRDVAAATQDARAALQLGNKIAAKNHLRRKHKSETRLQRCTSALENVQHLLIQMREVDHNAAIVDTYRTSSEVMKRGMKDSGLTEDAVHDTMDDLKEVMDSYNEVEKALSATIDDFDMAELEEELKELMLKPAAPGGGTPAKEEKKEGIKLPSPPNLRPNRRISERDFVFDGEERMLAELEELDADPSGGDKGKAKKKVAVAEEVEVEPPERTNSPATKSSKAWYPPSTECLRPDAPWTSNNNDELRQDSRIHPGQPLNVDFTTPPRHYGSDFQVRDHRLSGGVWLYNTGDSNRNLDAELAASTEYFSSESPGKTGAAFMMAPGGERKKSVQPQNQTQSQNQTTVWPQESVEDDLERRLKALRGFNL